METGQKKAVTGREESKTKLLSTESTPTKDVGSTVSMTNIPDCSPRSTTSNLEIRD
jgi:hypothetical protein